MPRDRLDAFIREQRERLHLDSSQPFPLFGLIEGDGRGGVWLSEFPADGRNPYYGLSHWSVVAANGEWLGSVTLPDGFRVLDISADRVLGVLRDSMDVESVAVFQLTPAPPGS
jgi:hypothetical protein